MSVSIVTFDLFCFCEELIFSTVVYAQNISDIISFHYLLGV